MLWPSGEYKQTNAALYKQIPYNYTGNQRRLQARVAASCEVSFSLSNLARVTRCDAILFRVHTRNGEHSDQTNRVTCRRSTVECLTERAEKNSRRSQRERQIRLFDADRKSFGPCVRTTSSGKCNRRGNGCENHARSESTEGEMDVVHASAAPAPGRPRPRLGLLCSNHFLGPQQNSVTHVNASPYNRGHFPCATYCVCNDRA